MTTVEELGRRAKQASRQMNRMGTKQKNQILALAAQALVDEQEEILKANAMDIEAARKKNMPEPMVDRLVLSESRIAGMAEGLTQLIALEDPIGEIISSTVRPNGLEICKKRVPIGVIGIIYESRPNVTADAFGLCFKTNNTVILKGGSDAIHSNMAITKILRKAIAAGGGCEDALLLVEDTSRETAKAMMRLNQYIDVLIPRGGAGLIRTVVENSTVPVIETGTGNCHDYVDASADIDMAVNIAKNAKCSRPSVCNAMETLLVSEKIAEKFLPVFAKAAPQVEIRGCEKTLKILPNAVKASEADYENEFLDLILAVKIVKDIDEAIEHIEKYSTGHSEAIITENYTNAEKFLDRVNSAAVYVNASTRFTDGFEFGFGAEIGISTQKLHARGPMGLESLTTTKYVIHGNGQVR